MAQKQYTITRKDLLDLLTRLSNQYRVLVPHISDRGISFEDFDPARGNTIEFGNIRQTETLKSFFFLSRESVTGIPESLDKPLLIAGVKSCDLESIDIQDFVFIKGEVKDPFYSKRRADTLIISSDCTHAKETCFCLAVEGQPYPKRNFDLNISQLGDRFLVEVGTDKGQSFIRNYRMFFKDPSREDEKNRDRIRESITSLVRTFIDERKTPLAEATRGAVKNTYNNTDMWKDLSSTCVECGACNFTCPTCHCFLLYDMKCPSGDARERIWDSCLYKTFARVAGGANARKHLFERLRNRIDKKFDYFPAVLKRIACTGCGRCIDACLGDIDIREILKAVTTGIWKKPPHE